MLHVSMNSFEITPDCLETIKQDSSLARTINTLYRSGDWDVEAVVRYRQSLADENKGKGMLLIDQGQLMGWYGLFPYAGDDYDYETTIYLHSSLHGTGLNQVIYAVLDSWRDEYPNACVSIHESHTKSLTARQKIYPHGWRLIDESFRNRKAYVRALTPSK